jgi:hypothetical protein
LASKARAASFGYEIAVFSGLLLVAASNAGAVPMLASAVINLSALVLFRNPLRRNRPFHASPWIALGNLPVFALVIVASDLHASFSGICWLVSFVAPRFLLARAPARNFAGIRWPGRPVVTPKRGKDTNER